MPNLYIEVEALKSFGVAPDADNTNVWNLLAENVSRLFDRECEVVDGFFNVVGDSVSLKSYLANGTRYLRLWPYTAGSITIIDVDGTDYYEAVAADRLYKEKDGYLIFDSEIPNETPVNVTAIYGFAAIPADVKFACIEQALAQWRKKDISFAEISGVSAAAVNAEFSPSFLATTKRYRELYSPNTYFS